MPAFTASALGAPGGEHASHLQAAGRVVAPCKVPLLEKGPSPIRIRVLEHFLREYPLKAQARYLREGFQYGFRIPYMGPRIHSMAPNLRSVVGMEEVVLRKINKEIALGRVLGPFRELPLPDLRISPLGVVPKKAPGEYRLIHHLSFPHGSSVNDRIPDGLCSMKYTSFDQAVKVVRSCGQGALLAKCDIESAFRLLPVHPADFSLLGFAFQGCFYIDRALPMGCSISCAAFEAFSSMLEWALRRVAGLGSTAHSLDDFLLVGRPGTEQCSHLLAVFQKLCADLGVPLAQEKTEGPSPILTFLGIELDTIAGCSRLPWAKIDILRTLLVSCIQARKVTLRQLQQLIGHLNFACRVVVPGRPFLRWLCDAIKGVRCSHHRVRVTAPMQADMQLWATFLESYNGASFWQDTLLLEAELQVQSDAAGGLGFGVYFRGRWCAERWPAAWVASVVTKDLTFLEFFPIVVAIHLWADLFRDKTVHFWCDNQATVQVIDRQTSRSPRVMILVRAFVLACLHNNIQFLACHVPGVQNSLADALSRFQVQRFRQLAPEAEHQPEARCLHGYGALAHRSAEGRLGLFGPQHVGSIH
ncbi:uncharacterized protein LOC128349104 [Hemicordylus capensis]|uniref:uncharacterized protein LOC128349104 n=1 Tax=Hemicordylus capensis TaxID=884348 RepID=UPI0023047CDB|nr:uncharacterized protein LOC128349104 [Hemicordylus capensis]XP_053161002.1 uncharacterized protein LOC128349104 [Hemicordylus capensis]XP_053161003.1 uncharacterized protein LOC128349104 [Hemicordylus capensis]